MTRPEPRRRNQRPFRGCFRSSAEGRGCAIRPTTVGWFGQGYGGRRDPCGGGTGEHRSAQAHHRGRARIAAAARPGRPCPSPCPGRYRSRCPSRCRCRSLSPPLRRRRPSTHLPHAGHPVNPDPHVSIARTLDRAVSTEPIVAWRAWALTGTPRRHDLLLRPVAGRSRPWRPLEPAEAACKHARLHGAPNVDCSCGLHGTHDADILRRTRMPAVLGRVALWGRVIEHELGYRAQFGYPQRLSLVCQFCFWQWGPTGSAARRRRVLPARRARPLLLAAPGDRPALRHGARGGCSPLRRSTSACARPTPSTPCRSEGSGASL